MAILEKNTVFNLEENEFELPIGYVDKDGTLHKTFKLREMTGEVDEAIANKKIRVNAGKMVTEAIYGVVEQLGTLPRVDRGVIQSLCNVDRDYILLMNHYYSLGEELEWVDNCPHCNSKLDLTVKISEVPVKFMTHDEKRIIHVELANGITNPETGEKHKEVVLSFPNGRVQEKVFNSVNNNPAEAITSLMAMCTEQIVGFSNYNFDTFKKMTKKDRKIIAKAITEIDVGAELNTEVECFDCGGHFKSPVPLMVLLGE